MVFGILSEHCVLNIEDKKGRVKCCKLAYVKMYTRRIRFLNACAIINIQFY